MKTITITMRTNVDVKFTSTAMDKYRVNVTFNPGFVTIEDKDGSKLSIPSDEVKHVHQYEHADNEEELLAARDKICHM